MKTPIVPAIAALLLTAPPHHAERIRDALKAAGIPCTDIGDVLAGGPQVLQRTPNGFTHYPWPERDSVARLFETRTANSGGEAE